MALADSSNLTAVKTPIPILKDEITDNPVSYYALAPIMPEYDVHQIDEALLTLLTGYRKQLALHQINPLIFQVDSCIATWPEPIEAARLSFSEHIGRIVVDKRVVLAKELATRRLDTISSISTLSHTIIADIFPDIVSAKASKDNLRKANSLSAYAAAHLRYSTKKSAILSSIIKLRHTKQQ